MLTLDIDLLVNYQPADYLAIESIDNWNHLSLILTIEVFSIIRSAAKVCNSE